MSQCTLPSSIMTDNENDQSFFSIMTDNENDQSFFSLLARDLEMFMNLIEEGESTFENVFSCLNEEEGNMNDNLSHPAMLTGDKKGKEELSSDEESDESLRDSNGGSTSDEEPAPKKRKKKADSSHETDSNASEEETNDEDADCKDESDMDENAFDEDMIEKELELPANRNRKEEGKAVEPNHHLRKLQRNMAAQGSCENRDVTQLTCMVATSPRLKAILDENLSKWKPSLPLLVRSTRLPCRLRSCRLSS
jgi:hypothetical protein